MDVIQLKRRSERPRPARCSPPARRVTRVTPVSTRLRRRHSPRAGGASAPRGRRAPPPSGAMDFSELEKREGVRLSWNAWPSSRIEATRVVLPFGAVCTPCRAMPEMPVLPYGPVVCTECSAVLNPYCMMDYHQKRCARKRALPRRRRRRRRGRSRPRSRLAIESAPPRRSSIARIHRRISSVAPPRPALFIADAPTRPKPRPPIIINQMAVLPVQHRERAAAQLPRDQRAEPPRGALPRVHDGGVPDAE